MELKTRIPNAFTIHWLMTTGGPMAFPFGVRTFREIDGVFALSLHPQAVIDVSDLFQTFERIAVFDVSHFEHDSQREKGAPLSQTAAAERVQGHVVDLNTIVIPGNALGEFLSDFVHYDLHVLDIPGEAANDAVVESVLKYQEYEWSETDRLLSRLPNSRIFLDSHDDCYLYLESRDLQLLKSVVSRALQMYAGTVLFEENGFEGKIAEVPGELLETLWPENSGLTIFRDETKTEGLSLRIGVSQQAFRFQEDCEYPVSLLVEYDARVGEWHLPGRSWALRN